MGEYSTESTETWQVVGRPGFLGKDREQFVAAANERFGEGDWQIMWQMANGELWTYDQIFWQLYVPGYVAYFLRRPEEAQQLTAKRAYIQDKAVLSANEVFDPHAYYDRPGQPNQFHNVAMNIALV